MKILITGGKGWIGGVYLQAMKAQGHTCKAYDLPKDDILNLYGLKEAIKKADMVVHFAAIADLYDSAKNLTKNFEVNVRGTYNIGLACSELNKKLVFISTCCVYGNTGHKIETEDGTIPRTNEPYATTKAAGEYILRGIPALQYIILRIGTVYGPGQRPTLFTHIALDAVHKGKQIHIHGTGEQTRTLVYIDDLVEGIMGATFAFDKIPNGDIINICGNEQISAIKTVKTAEKVTGKKAGYDFVDDRYGQTMRENASIKKAERLFGWTPTTDFIVGMGMTYKNDKRFK